MTQELNETLAKLADKLGTSVEKIYSVLTKQAKIDAILGVVYLVFILVGAFVVWELWQYIIPLCKPANPTPQYSWDTDWPVSIQVGVCLLGVATVTLLICFIAWLSDSLNKILTAIYNPESSAIEKIINALR